MIFTNYCYFNGVLSKTIIHTLIPLFADCSAFYIGNRGISFLKMSLKKGSTFLEQIICRVCDEQLLRKNYKTHLQRKHPKENEMDLRGKNQQSLGVLFENLSKREIGTKNNMTAEDDKVSDEELDDPVADIASREPELRNTTTNDSTGSTNLVLEVPKENDCEEKDSSSSINNIQQKLANIKLNIMELENFISERKSAFVTITKQAEDEEAGKAINDNESEKET